MRLAACEAELERWEASAASYAKVSAAKNQLPSVYIEALARQGYALFNLDRQGEADAVLAAADDVFDKAQAEQSERFSTYYFVGMARFYRAAILHWKFRDVEFSSGQSKAQLEKAFYRKMELLSLAQDAYYHAIRAKHMFWVSASGYQLGRLFGEFYDAVMYAPVPSWLNDHQRVVYFEELKKQSRPVIEKAIWQLERNLDAARRLGYESPFVELTEAKLTHLRGVLLSGDSLFGKPHPRLVPELAEDIGPQGGDETELSAVDRELFVPLPTPL
jgi:hypothetical protein